MEGISKEVIIPKNQTQLRTDIKWVNLQRIGDKPLFKTPQDALENPRGFIKEIRKLHQNPDDLANSPYAQYNEYLQTLRYLRKVQAHIKPPANTLGESPREAYLERKGFVRSLAIKVLAKINEVHVGSNEKRVFTEQEFNQGVQNEHDFMTVLNTGLDRQPEAFYKAVHHLIQVLPVERIKEVITKASAKNEFINWGFIHNFGTLKSFFTLQEQRALIDAELSIKHNTYFVPDLFKDPDTTKLYTPDEIHTIIVENFKDGHAQIDSYDAKHYLDHGVITPKDLTQITLYYVNKLGDISNLPRRILPLLPDDNSRLEVKTAIFDVYTNRANAKNSYLWAFKDMFTPTEKFQMVSSIALRDRSGALGHIDTYEDMTSPQEFAPILREILTTPNLQLDGYAVNCILKANGLTEDEKEQFIDRLISTNRADLALYGEGSSFGGFSSEEKRNQIARKVLLNCDARQAAKTYNMRGMGGGGWWHQVSKEVAIDVIKNTKFSEAGEWLSRFDRWSSDFSESNPGSILDILEKYRDTNVETLLYILPSIVNHIPQDSKMSFVQDLIRANPIMALIAASRKGEENIFSKSHIAITSEQIVQLFYNDTNRLSFAPKTFREFIKRYNPQAAPEEQKALLIETFNIYRSIAFIKALGLENEFRRIQSGNELSPAKERELLSTFYCFALLKDHNSQEFSKLSNLGGSLEEAKTILFNQLSEILGINKQLNQDEINKFFDTMETPVPYMIYFLQQGKSAIHKKLLRGIFESITQGQFSEWKYGEATQVSLDQLKSVGLLPASLTLEQYLMWKTDGQVSLVDSLATDTQTTANAIISYLEGNLEHLQIEEVMEGIMEDLTDESTDQNPLSVLQVKIATVGQRLATINKELSDLRKTTGGIDRITELEEEKLKLDNNRKELLRARRIIRLLTVKPNEVALGYFLEGKDSKQKGESLVQVLNDLEVNAPEENRFVYSEVKIMINALSNTSTEKQNLLCTDSSNPKVLLEIGENPVASCQSYINGGHNDCLVAYTDPNTKILILRNEKGNIIARSIFRLLATSTGLPALHIERIYSSSTSKAVLRTMYTRAYQKAQEMGVPLLISEQSQDEGGVEKELQTTEGYQVKKVDYSLISKASRAPKVYVDSAGGVVKDGDYEMTNLLEIRQAA